MKSSLTLCPLGMLFAAGILSGIPWGAFQTLTTTYAADVCPIPLRPILTTFVNMCWVIGQLLTTGILRGLLTRQDDWAWRIPYAIQWGMNLRKSVQHQANSSQSGQFPSSLEFGLLLSLRPGLSRKDETMRPEYRCDS